MPKTSSASLANQQNFIRHYSQVLTAREAQSVSRALELVRKTLVKKPIQFKSPLAVRDYLQLELALEEREVFVCLWLDAQNRLIEAERMFVGTLTQTSVYPREVVKTALWHNAAAVVIAHNHPSGEIAPSEADVFLTTELKSALALVDVRVLDHFIVAGDAQPLSFAEHGLTPFGDRVYQPIRQTEAPEKSRKTSRKPLKDMAAPRPALSAMEAKSATLRIDDKSDADTRHVVRSVLEFMGMSFSAIYSSNDDLTPEAMLGAAQIMNVCVCALQDEKLASTRYGQ